jgi:hypothetical protein
MSFLPISGELPVLLHFKLVSVFAKYVKCLVAHAGVTIVFSNETTNGRRDTNLSSVNRAASTQTLKLTLIS